MSHCLEHWWTQPWSRCQSCRHATASCPAHGRCLQQQPQPSYLCRCPGAAIEAVATGGGGRGGEECRPTLLHTTTAPAHPHTQATVLTCLLRLPLWRCGMGHCTNTCSCIATAVSVAVGSCVTAHEHAHKRQLTKHAKTYIPPPPPPAAQALTLSTARKWCSHNAWRGTVEHSRSTGNACTCRRLRRRPARPARLASA